MKKNNTETKNNIENEITEEEFSNFLENAKRDVNIRSISKLKSEVEEGFYYEVGKAAEINGKVVNIGIIMLLEDELLVIFSDNKPVLMLNAEDVDIEQRIYTGGF